MAGMTDELRFEVLRNLLTPPYTRSRVGLARMFAASVEAEAWRHYYRGPMQRGDERARWVRWQAVSDALSLCLQTADDDERECRVYDALEVIHEHAPCGSTPGATG